MYLLQSICLLNYWLLDILRNMHSRIHWNIPCTLEYMHSGTFWNTSTLEHSGIQALWNILECKHSGTFWNTSNLEHSGIQALWNILEYMHSGTFWNTGSLEHSRTLFDILEYIYSRTLWNILGTKCSLCNTLATFLNIHLCSLEHYGTFWNTCTIEQSNE